MMWLAIFFTIQVDVRDCCCDRSNIAVTPENMLVIVPDSKVHEANMGPIWDRQDPGGPHVGPMNFTIWGIIVRGL